jgi:flagellar hook-associated protein 1 FlgK
MINSFYGLEMARRATNAFRLGIQTAGHNISNVQTEGYSRQRVNLVTCLPFPNPGMMSPVMPGQIGTGVEVNSITRVRDAFLDFQYRQEMSPLGYWAQIKTVFNNIEMFIAEPNRQGIQSSLDEFWTSLQELSKNPESAPVREAVIQQAKTFGTFLDQLVANLDKYADQLNSQVKYGVDDVNDKLTQIAALNKTIAQLEAAGMNPNDLYDRRDLLVDKLSQLINISVKPPCALNDEYIIDLNGRNLVQGDRVRRLVAHEFLWDGKTYYNVQVEDNEFDIVANCSVADVIPGGPDGAHQLDVHRLATESSWKMGGGDAFCLDVFGNIVKDASGNDVKMRLRPRTASDSLNLTGSFRLQVGNSGVKASSANLVQNALGRSGVPNGQVLGEGIAMDIYTFRVSAGDFERNVTVRWNDSINKWDISDDVGTTVVSSLGKELMLEDISSFLRQSLLKHSPADSGEETFEIDNTYTGGVVTQFGIKSCENWLVSIVDVKGDLASRIGLSNDSREGSAPVITIDIEPDDTLQTICNKINEKYSILSELTSAEQWLHASIAINEDETVYITLESNVIGESNRINILGDEDGNMQMLRRLGLISTQQYGTDGSGNSIYREVTNVIEQAKDASFTFDGKEYLSESNMFKDARKIPAGNDYSAKYLEEVSLGLRFKLKNVGNTGILILNHVTNGELRALQDARDKIIPSFIDAFDEMIYTLVNEFNAVHYAGYGIGDAVAVTGTAFYNPVKGRYGASGRFAVNDLVAKNIDLIGAAMGNGFGKTNGIGDGSNALSLAQLKHAKILNNKSADFNAFYEGFIAKLGSQSAESRLMDRNQNYLVTAIETNRQSVMGVNIDEEMLDILQFTHAFNAMARYVNTIDEMLDRLINGFGLVGR